MTQIDYLFFEPPLGVALFKVVHQADTVGHNLKEVQESIQDLSRFGRMVQLANYTPSSGTPDVLAQIEQLSKGKLPEPIRAALELALPKTGKKAKITLAVPDKFLAVAVRNAFPGVSCETPDSSAVAASLLRGVRQYYPKLVEGLNKSDMDTISAVNGTLFSRGRVKYSAQRDDKYIIAAITSLESLDKGLNLFSMRVREWYGAHFPELFNLVRDAVPYVKCVIAVRNKNSLDDDKVSELAEIVGDDTDIAESIVRVARTSVGVELREEDLDKIMSLAESFLHQAQTRACTAAYLENKLSVVAPNLQVILGTVLTARLIAQAGSLKELAKKPASTVQILGAEKALFRALKTKGNTPKYGILYHASYIAKAGARDKGRIARYLANKCSLAARIDVFSEEPGTEFGEAFKGQIEGRLRFLATGEKQPKNDEVLAKVVELLGDMADEGVDDEMDVDEEPKKEKKDKKDKKKDKKEKEKKEKRKSKSKAEDSDEDDDEDDVEMADAVSAESSKKDKKKKKAEDEPVEKKKKRKSEGDAVVADGKSKKKRKHD